MLTNSAVIGLLGAAYLSVLVLQLNPHLPLTAPFSGALFGILALFYGVHISVLCYGLIVARQLVVAEVLSPGWVSVRLLAWLGAATCGVASLLMWLNLQSFRATLAEDAARRMATGAIATSACVAAMFALAMVHYSSRRRGSGLSAVVLTFTMCASIALPLAARGWGQPQPLNARRLDLLNARAAMEGVPRLVVIVIDGASLDYIAPAAAAERFPNFGKLLDGGAAMHLATLKPTQPGPVYGAMVTGKYPPASGVRSAATYQIAPHLPAIDLLPDLCYSHLLVRVGLLTEVPNTSAALRARPVWSIASAFGIPVGVVGMPLTYPVEQVRGFLVSDRLHAALAPAVEEPEVTFPREALDLARQLAGDDSGSDGDVVTAGLTSPSGLDVLGRAPTPGDRLYAAIGSELQRQHDTALTIVRYQGLDTVAHYFLRYAVPRDFGDVSEHERRRYGQVLNGYYAYLDAAIGRAIDALGPQDLLLVVSGFGMQPVSLGKRLLARAAGDPDLSGSHEQAPDGFLLAYGGQVQPGRLPLGSIVDVAPTILYYFDLPVGRDMDGYARTDIFRREFTAERPLTFIPTHER